MSDSDSDGEQAEPRVGFKFSAGQKVFCFHGPLMYEARCVKSELRGAEKKPHYLIHYHGWNKNWDEWVEESRVREFTDANVKMAEELKAKQRPRGASGQKGTKRKSGAIAGTPNSTAGSPVSSNRSEKEAFSGDARLTGGKDGSASKAGPSSGIFAPSTSGKGRDDPHKEGPSTSAKSATKKKNGQKSTKPGMRADYAPDNCASRNKTIKIDIPMQLKEVLIDDINLVKNENKIVSLPPPKTIHQMLEDYVKERHESENKARSEKDEETLKEEDSKDFIPISNHGSKYHKSCYREVADGLKVYFNEVIGTMLLYKLERLQYAEIMKQTRLETADSDEERMTNGTADKSHQAGTSYQDKFRSRKNSNAVQKNGDSEPKQTTISENATTSQTGKSFLGRVDMTHYYAPIHFLRLFPKLGKLLTLVHIDDAYVNLLSHFFGDVLDYLKDHREELFPLNQYYCPPPEYVRKVSH